MKTDFAITNDNASAVAEICRRLDGLPLALELAAARIKVFPPQALLSRLSSRFALLKGGARDLPERHQALHATIDWSYHLLDGPEKTLFARFSVFAGGCTLEAAEQVCNGEGDLGVDLLDGVTSLLEKSLLQQRGLEEPRFDMLESIREYAREQLEASGEAASVRRAHAACYVELARHAGPQMLGRTQAPWFQRLEEENDNFRSALSWLLESGNVDDALRLCSALVEFWDTRGYIVEGQRWLEQALVRADGADGSLRALALSNAGSLANRRGEYGKATSYFEQSLRLCRDLEIKPGIAANLNGLGSVAQVAGEYTRADVLLNESLALYREMGDTQRIGITLGHLGIGAYWQGAYERAELYYRQSMELARETGNERGVAMALANLGAVAVEGGDLGEGRRLLMESLALCIQLSDMLVAAEVVENLAHLATREGDTLQAVRLFGMAGTLRDELGSGLAPPDRTIHERYVETVRRDVGDVAWHTAWTEGSGMVLEDLASPAPASDQ